MSVVTYCICITLSLKFKQLPWWTLEDWYVLPVTGCNIMRCTVKLCTCHWNPGIWIWQGEPKQSFWNLNPSCAKLTYIISDFLPRSPHPLLSFVMTMDEFASSVPCFLYFVTWQICDVCTFLCFWQVVNGVVQTPGDQDAEDTQLMAIYAKDSQTEDKVSFS